MEEHEYVLGTNDDELTRLGFQHQVWAEHTSAIWARARFAPGDRLLDLGCGPGYATADLAQLVGAAGNVDAVDVSARFLASLQRMIKARALDNVRWQQSDATSLDIQDSTLDGAFARWVLCFTPDAAAAVREVARVLRPGARFAVMDYANYEAFTMAPPSAAFDHVIAATGESVKRRGGDFGVGRMLPRLLHDAGFDVEYVEPIVRVARPHTALWQWPTSFFANYLPTLIDAGLITTAQREAFEQVWRERSSDPAAYLVTPTMVGVIGVRR